MSSSNPRYRASWLLAAAVFVLVGCKPADDRPDQSLAELQAIRQELGAIRQLLARSPGTARAGEAEAAPRIEKVALGASPRLGKNTARVAVVEFSDYQCPFCARHHATSFSRLRTTYLDSGKVQYVFKNAPLAGHPEAKPAALAAYCANQQGAFWAMKRELFGNQARLGPAFYSETARRLQLKEAEFARCVTEPAALRQVEIDAQYSNSIGVTGTPTFFIGRIEGDAIVEVQRLVGAQPYESFAAVLDKVLAEPVSREN